MSLGLGLGLGMGGGRVVTPKTIAGSKVVLWLRADKGTTGSPNVSAWADQSGNGRDFSQGTLSKRPDYTASAIGGKPALFFNGSTELVGGPSFDAIAAIGSGEMFGVIQRALDPPTTGFGGAWRLGSPIGQESFYPNSVDLRVYEGFLSTTRKATNITKATGYWTQPHIVQCLSAPSDWRMWLDGTLEYSTATNTVGSSSSTAIGGDTGAAGVLMHGYISEVIVCAPVLTVAERAKMLKYLKARYQIV